MDQAVLVWAFEYAGPGADAEKLLGPFNAIEALNVGSNDSYPAISGAAFPHLQRHDTGLQRHNLTHAL